MDKVDRLDQLLRYQELFDIYLNLLTERLQEILQMFFFEDLGFSEIAENLNISRQAVYDSIKQAIKNLENYENILNILEKKKILKNEISLLKREINKEAIDKLRIEEIINKIENI